MSPSPEPTAPEKTHFVREVASRASLPAHITAEAATTAVMCAVTERLTPGGAHALIQGLPASVRPLFERCVEHRSGPVSSLDRVTLLERTAAHLGVTPLHAEAICRAVFRAIRDELPSDVAEHVSAQLPGDLKALWYSEPGTISMPVASEDEPETLRVEVLAAIERAAGALPPGIDASAALMAVMCIFCQRLSGGEARHIFLALPSTLRSLLATCMMHKEESPEPFDENEFLQRVSGHLGTDQAGSANVVRAVFAGVRRCLPPKEIEDAASQLPPDLRSLWLGG